MSGKQRRDEEGSPYLTSPLTDLRRLGIEDNICCHSARMIVGRRPDCDGDILYYSEVLAAKSRMVDSSDWARAKNLLGLAYLDKTSGDRADSISLALQCFNQSLEVTSKVYDPMFWAEVMNNLGILYTDYGQFLDPNMDFVEMAISHFEQALTVRKRASDPKAWSETMNNMGIAYMKRRVSTNILSAELAVRCFRLSLRARTRESDPRAWAETTENLGMAFAFLMPWDRENNIESAIMCFKLCTKIKTRQVDAHGWAVLTCKLAALYLCRTRGDRRQNMDMAIKAYEQCTKFITRSNRPELWALVMEILGGLHMNRESGTRRENLEAAILCYKLSLKVRTVESNPISWMETMKTLGALYLNRISGDRTSNDEAAIRCFENCLQVNKNSVDPAMGAEVMKRLGDLYANRATGNFDHNARKAITYLNQSLDVLTRESDPVVWAEIMHSLGRLYVKNDDGKVGQNIELGIKHFLDALKVRTRSTDAEEWATTNSYLGFAYTERKSGDKDQNVELAIACFENCLSVVTKDSDAVEWAKANLRLGIAYIMRNVQSEELNIEKGIHHCRQSLTILTSDSYPLHWASAMMALGNAYLRRRVGAEVENRERSIEYYQHSLTVCTRAQDPKQWGMIMHCLGVLYYHRKAGEESENIEWSIYFFKQVLSDPSIDQNPQQWASSTMNLGFANMGRISGRREQNLKSALVCFQQVLEIARSEPDVDRWLDLQLSLGLCKLCLGRMKEGYATLSAAASALEKHVINGRIRWSLRRLERAYVSILGLLLFGDLREGNVTAALEMSERERIFRHGASMSYFDLAWSIKYMGRKSNKSGDRNLARVFESFRRLEAYWPMREESREENNIVTDLHDFVADLEATSVNRKLSNKWSRFADALATPFETQDLFRVLDDDTVAIAFCNGPISYETSDMRFTEGMHLFAVHNGKVAHRALLQNQNHTFQIEYTKDCANSESAYAPTLPGLENNRQELRIAVTEILQEFPGVQERETPKIIVVPDAKWCCAPLLVDTEEVQNETLELLSRTHFGTLSGHMYFTPSLTFYSQHSLHVKRRSVKEIKAISRTRSFGVAGAECGLLRNLKRSLPRSATADSEILTLPKIWYTPHQLPFNELRGCDLLTLVLSGSTKLNSGDEPSSVSDSSRVRNNVPDTKTLYSGSHDQAQFSNQELISRMNLYSCRLACIILISSDDDSGCATRSPGFALGTSLLLAGAEHVICTLWPIRQTTAALILHRIYKTMEARKTDGEKAGRMTIARSLRAAKSWFRNLPSRDAQAAELFRLGLTDSLAEAQSLGFADASDPREWAGFILLGPTEWTGESDHEKNSQCNIT